MTYLRDTDFITLEDLWGKVREKHRTWSGSSTKPEVHFAEHSEPVEYLGSSLGIGETLTLTGPDGEERTLTSETLRPRDDEAKTLGVFDFGGHEVPITERGLTAMAAFYQIPSKFLLRISTEEQQFLLTQRIQRTEDTPLVVKYTERGVFQAYKATGIRLTPSEIIEEVMSVFGEDAQVVEWSNTPEFFHADVIVPEGDAKYVGGDRDLGDLAFGGVRIGMNRKQNLAPYVQPYIFRVAETNGFEVPVYGIRVDSRHKDEFDVLAEYRNEVQVALDHTVDDMAHLYDLRSQPITDDATGLFRKIALEYDLPARTVGKMEDRLPDALLQVGEPTLFDFANHLANQANDPDFKFKYNVRRALEQAGGTMITDHAARCERCHSRLA